MHVSLHATGLCQQEQQSYITHAAPPMPTPALCGGESLATPHHLTATSMPPPHLPVSSASHHTGRPQPWVFSAYRLVNFLVNVIMWLLLLVVVGVLMVMLLTLGASAAVNGAITQGIATGDQALRPLGLDFGAASDAQQALASFVNPLVNDTPLGALISESSAPFQPICPPICLNLGSFASVLQSNSCICGNDTLQRLRQLAGDCMRVGAVALAGAGAMYIAATVLLMVLSGHFVSARHDRADARKLKEQRELEYENGYAADPSDCVQQEDVLPVTSAPNSRRGTQVALGPRY